MEITIDIETNLAHDTIWCVGTFLTGSPFPGGGSGLDIGALHDDNYLTDEDYTAIIGHNIIGFDAPVLRKVWDISLPNEKLLDTLILSRLWNPSLEIIKGSDGKPHSLKSWGIRLKMHKGDFTDFEGGYTEEMGEYCLNDVAITTKLKEFLTYQLGKDGFSHECIELEHEVAFICKEQEDNGFKLDVDKATQLYETLTAEMRRIEAELQETFPPIITERWSEKVPGKQLQDGVEVFNIGSRQQIAQRLQSLGHVFTEKTPVTEKGGGGNWIVNEKVLAEIDLPEAALINRYLMLQKRTSLVDSWLSCVTPEGRVHGTVTTNGAITGRMTHSNPNMAQITAKGKPYGKECRECWTVDEGNKLVGIDASGLELRMLAHYMKDEDYTAEVLEGDVHTANMNALGITDRNAAKTFIYAWLYGCGAGKAAKILGVKPHQGQAKIDEFLKNTPALGALKKLVEKLSAKGTLPGLDGRRLRVRSAHAALNTLLQGAGAVVMKKALVCFHESLTLCDIPFKIVANVHDEWQVETPERHAEAVGDLGVKAIIEAGGHFNLRCPLDGEYNVGNSWAETH